MIIGEAKRHKESPESRGFFGLFSKKRGEDYYTQTSTLVCDICTRKVDLDVHFYSYAAPIVNWPYSMKRYVFGIKKSEFDACDTHSEKELREFTESAVASGKF